MLPFRELSNRGAQLGFSFLNEGWGVSADEIKYVTTERAIDLLVENVEYLRLNPSSYSKCARMTFVGQDLYASIFFNDQEGHLKLLLIPPNASIDNGFHHRADFSSYTKLLIDLSSNFAILDLTTFDSYYNEY